MSQKFSIYDTEAAHNEIGQAIHDAKRRFLDAHKKGVRLQSAAETFFAECKNVIDRAEIRLQTPETAHTGAAIPSDSETEDLTNLELERLVKIVMEGGDGDRDGELAFLELLSHIIPHDGSGFAAIARKAVLKNAVAINDEAADLIVSLEQSGRKQNRKEAPVKSSNGKHEASGRPKIDRTKPLRESEIDDLVEVVLSYGDADKGRSAALILLLDEFATDHTGSAITMASRAALRSADTADLLVDRYVKALRNEYAGEPPEHGVTFRAAFEELCQAWKEGEAL